MRQQTVLALSGQHRRLLIALVAGEHEHAVGGHDDAGRELESIQGRSVGKDRAAVAERYALADVVVDVAVEHFQPAAPLWETKPIIWLVERAFIKADDHDDVAPNPFQPAVHDQNTVIVPCDGDPAVFAAK